MYEFLPGAIDAIRRELENVGTAIDALEKYAQGGAIRSQATLSSAIDAPTRRRGRKPLTADQKRAQSDRMKAYWAQRRK